MIVIAGGDSFTAGEEILDEELYPNFPGYVEDKNTNRDTRYAWYVEAKKIRFKKYPNIQAMERDWSFANQIARMMNWRITNHGVGGANQQFICQSIMRSVLEHRIAGGDPSELIVLVNLTSPYRMMAPIANKWHSILLGHDILPHHTKEYAAYDRLFTMNTDDLMLYEQQALHLVQLISFLKSHSVKFLLLDSVFLEHIDKFVQSDQSSELLKGMWGIIKQQSGGISCMETVAVESGVKDIWCAGGHFSKEVHTKFAQYLLGNISRL